MSSSDEEVAICTPPSILEAARTTSEELLPQVSKKKYEIVYTAFMDWRSEKNINSYSENVLLAYFGELAQRYKSFSLWAQYSMLKSTLNINNNVDISKYSKLRAFLKRKSEGYIPKKAKTFTPEEINKFIKESPNGIYLATKVRE